MFGTQKEKKAISPECATRHGFIIATAQPIYTDSVHIALKRAVGVVDLDTFPVESGEAVSCLYEWLCAMHMLIKTKMFVVQQALNNGPCKFMSTVWLRGW